jgi:hypothetical protein
MTSTLRIALALTGALFLAAPAVAQQAADPAAQPAVQAPPEPDNVRPITMQHFRPVDSRGINIFETPKEEGVPYTGFKLDFNAAFATQMQDLEHSNTATPVVVDGVNRNELVGIGRGFNNSTANLTLNGQLAEGIRVQTTVYLSSRHHTEAWVKDGYLLVDKSPLDIKPLNALFKYVTLKAGHMEINYGDAHFRRSDNGNAIYNPFVGNYILDAFTTEMGAEVYVRAKGLLAMGALMGGEIKGGIRTPEKRGPSYIGKVGFDRQLTEDARVRLTTSFYINTKSPSNTLYTGDRAGSRYYSVLENTASSESSQAWSGTIRPGFNNEVTAWQFNPFVKFRGLEVFGVIERAEGRASTEPADRVWKQQAVDVVYRALPNESAYIGYRYNRARGELAGVANEVGVNRWQLAVGWYVLPGLLVKIERVHQEYVDFPASNINNGGVFKGTMFEGVIAF